MQPGEDAYGALSLHSDKLVLEMRGAPPPAACCPNGWPTELPLPPGGRLTASTGSSGAAFAAEFVQVWLYILRVCMMPILSPMQAVSRMLTSSGDGGGGGGGGGERSGADAMAAGGRVASGAGGRVASGAEPQRAVLSPPRSRWGSSGAAGGGGDASPEDEAGTLV
jgi:hypothetical protein